MHMRSPREDFEAAARHLPPVHGSSAPSPDDMPTVPIPARKAATTFDTPSSRERLEVKPAFTRVIRRTLTGTFGIWSRLSALAVRHLGWYPRVEPYVGYGTSDYSRLICRTVYALSLIHI